MSAQKGFFGALFDLSFSSLVTTKVIKVVYVITLIVIVLSALLFTIGAFQQSAGLGVFVLLIVAPVVSLLYALFARIVLEFFIAIFRIMETNQSLLDLQLGKQPPPAGGPGLSGPPTTPAPSAPATPGPFAGPEPQQE